MRQQHVYIKKYQLINLFQHCEHQRRKSFDSSQMFHRPQPMTLTLTYSDYGPWLQPQPPYCTL